MILTLAKLVSWPFFVFLCDHGDVGVKLSCLCQAGMITVAIHVEPTFVMIICGFLSRGTRQPSPGSCSQTRRLTLFNIGEQWEYVTWDCHKVEPMLNYVQ